MKSCDPRPDLHVVTAATIGNRSSEVRWGRDRGASSPRVGYVHFCFVTGTRLNETMPKIRRGRVLAQVVTGRRSSSSGTLLTAGTPFASHVSPRGPTSTIGRPTFFTGDGGAPAGPPENRWWPFSSRSPAHRVAVGLVNSNKNEGPPTRSPGDVAEIGGARRRRHVADRRPSDAAAEGHRTVRGCPG